MNSEFEHSSCFNGFSGRIIFCIWAGEELMSENRLRALWSIYKNTGRPVVFVTQDTLGDWILPEAPLHPAYNHLSSTHKSDYLRCYLMHHYGGGYTDIKYTTTRWAPFFEQLEVEGDAVALGYTELAHGMPHLQGKQGDIIRAAHKDLIGLCAFIFKPRSELTSLWYTNLNKVLDQKLSLLERNPARNSLDQYNITLPNGEKSRYPLRWSEILGDIIHPLFFDYRGSLIKAPIEPVFHSYR